MKKVLAISALFVFAIAFNFTATAGQIPGDAWTMDFGTNRDIGCSPSNNVCCDLSAYVDDNSRIHVVISGHDGNTYDIIIMVAKDENDAKQIVIQELNTAGLQVPSN